MDHPTYPNGQCTRYVADTWGDPVGPYWGDGLNWLHSASADGYSTATTPSVGSIAVWGANMGGTGVAGHVAIVTHVDPLIVRESNWNVPLTIDSRVVSSGSRSGIIGYVLPRVKEGPYSMNLKRALIFQARLTMFGVWPKSQTEVDSFASQLSDDLSNYEAVITDMERIWVANGGTPFGHV